MSAFGSISTSAANRLRTKAIPQTVEAAMRHLALNGGRYDKPSHLRQWRKDPATPRVAHARLLTRSGGEPRNGGPRRTGVRIPNRALAAPTPTLIPRATMHSQRRSEAADDAAGTRRPVHVPRDNWSPAFIGGRPRSMTDLHVVILAAGKGTRMKSALPKVLHRVAGAPMIEHVLATARTLQPRTITVVVGHQGKALQEALSTHSDLNVVVQEPQLGSRPRC